jgi:hypothetical protein
MRLKLSFLVLCLLAGCGVPKPPTVTGKNLRPINPGYPSHYVERTLAVTQPSVAVNRTSPVELAHEATSPVVVNAEPVTAHAGPASSALDAASPALPDTSVPAPPSSQPAAAPDYSSPLFAMPGGDK